MRLGTGLRGAAVLAAVSGIAALPAVSYSAGARPHRGVPAARSSTARPKKPKKCSKAHVRKRGKCVKKAPAPEALSATLVVEVCSYGGPAPGTKDCGGDGPIYVARLGRDGEAGKRTLTRQRTIHVAPGRYEVGLYETINASGPGPEETEETYHRYGKAKIVTVRAGQVAEVTVEGPPIP